MQRLCHLQQAVARIEACPEDRCGLWDDGGCEEAGPGPHRAYYLWPGLL